MQYEPYMSFQSIMHMLFLLMALMFALPENFANRESTEVIEKVVYLSKYIHKNELVEEVPQIKICVPVPPYFHFSLVWYWMLLAWPQKFLNGTCVAVDVHGKYIVGALVQP